MFGSDWEVGTGDSSGFKSLTAFYPKEASSSNGIIVSLIASASFLVICFFFISYNLHINFPHVGASVSVAITGLGPDFTKMESFGKVDEFAETLVL